MNHPTNKTEPIRWEQGWARDESIRQSSSSGGLAAAIQYGFVKSGGIVCSCLFENGKFIFDLACTEEEIKKFSGSKYVKSNPGKIYAKITELLKEGKKVLFVGLPCQCAAARNYTKDHELLYTVDLICHGSPSPTILEMFLKEKGYRIETMGDVTFRKKTNFHLSDEKKSIAPPTVRDRYTMAFLNALCYTENCYSCQHAEKARVSDITLGDSWGSTLEEKEQRKGISLVLCQTQKGEELLAASNIHLESVDVERAIANNRQLNHPSTKPEERTLFFATLQKKKNFNKAVKKCYPKTCFRQSIKAFLINAKLRRVDKNN